ncbi:mucin-2-like isoform X2 [Acipenser ruthenus]|uniref:mucin-2-like isoform X2 n=1 Tax=Acipenser ruthenus TaxID=7906 RepID=UPI0027417801|nr:mucin-2-like isoform X2 [Acipenser ruthenus]
MERISPSALIWLLIAVVFCYVDVSAIQASISPDVTPALTTSPSVESTIAEGLISTSPPLPPAASHMTLPAESPSTTVQSTDTLASPASDIERQASTGTSLNSSTTPPRANETLPTLPELRTNETFPALPELRTNETLPALPELRTNETLPALPELRTNETLPALPELRTNETLPALPELSPMANGTEGNTSLESAAESTQEPATTLTPSQESEASTGSLEYPPQSATPANVTLGAKSPKTSESPAEIPASPSSAAPTIPTLPPTAPPARETSRPHTPGASTSTPAPPAKLNQVSPPVFDIGDDQSVSAQSPASTSMEPLVAGLISLFIIALGLVSTLLYLRFQQRCVRPEFRRLQDLPMDDMMEDTPLSLYSY